MCPSRASPGSVTRSPPDQAFASVPRLPRDSDAAEFEERLGEEYLSQAHEALLASVDPHHLYEQRARRRNADPALQAAARVLARKRRLRSARTSILFSALSIEATVNEFLGLGLRRADFAAVDKLSTIEKLMIGPRLVLGEPLFDRGKEPTQTVTRLMRLRNVLVHPKARPIRVAGDSRIDEPGFGDYNPEIAAQYLLAVARASSLLLSVYPDAEELLVAPALLAARTELVGSCRSGSHQLPGFHAPRPGNIVAAAISREVTAWTARRRPAGR